MKKYIEFKPEQGWPAAKNLNYECQICGSILPSLSNKDCRCGNLYTDESSARIGAKRPSEVRLLEITPD